MYVAFQSDAVRLALLERLDPAAGNLEITTDKSQPLQKMFDIGKTESHDVDVVDVPHDVGLEELESSSLSPARYGGVWMDPAMICLKPFELFIRQD